jgi:hypothetical protein
MRLVNSQQLNISLDIFIKSVDIQNFITKTITLQLRVTEFIVKDHTLRLLMFGIVLKR